MPRQVAIIGAGNVGATCAQRILERGVSDVALVDLVDGLAAGKALDLAEAAPLEGHDRHITGSTSYDIVKNSEVVVVTAGLARKPGMSRSDLLEQNAKIIQSIVPNVAAQAPKAILIVVTNPLDIMTYVSWRLTGWEPHRVMGMAGVLDSARFRFFVAERLGVSVKDVQAMVLGGHGDSMVALAGYATVSGVPLPNVLPQAEIEKLIQRTRDGGAEVVKLLKTGSAFYAPASSVADMVQSILLDEKRILPACVRLSGQYGLKDVFCGVPVRLGSRGVEEIIEVPLTPQEKAALAASAQGVRQEMTAAEALISSATARASS